MKPFSALASISYRHPVVSGLLFISSISAGILLCIDHDKRPVTHEYPEHSAKDSEYNPLSKMDIYENVAYEKAEQHATDSGIYTDSNANESISPVTPVSSINESSSIRDSICTCIRNHRYKIAAGCFIFAATVGCFYIAGWAQQVDILQIFRKTTVNQPLVSESITNAPDPSPQNISDIELLSVDDTCTEKDTIKVKLHFRKLPSGHRPSPEKVQEANRLGIILEEGYTIVDAHDRSISVISAA